MDAGRGARRFLAVALSLAAILAAGLPVAVGAEETAQRDEYVAELERICKPRALATERAMKGARADLSAERLAVAAGKFGRAQRIFGATVVRIAAVPRPPADLAKLRRWVYFLGRQEDYLRQIGIQLRADRAVPAQRLAARFIHNGNLANEVVLPFGFEFCAFKFARYG